MKNELFSIGPFTVHGYGLMIAIGILVAYVTAEYRAKKHGLDPDKIFYLVIWAVVGGFAGAKVLYFLTRLKDIMENPRVLLDLADGFVVYGGIIGGIYSAMAYCRIKKMPFLKYFDLVMPSVALAQGFGRIGCFLAGCCYGRETQSFLGVVFPANSMAPAGIKVLPTQLFSSAGDFLITAILLLYYKKIKHTGDGGALYMILYGVGRFLMEFLRADDRGNIGMLSTSQMISIVIVAGAVVLLWQNRRRDRELL